MKLRIEVDPDCSEEVVIRARGMSDEILRVRNAIETVLSNSGEIAVKKSGETSYIKLCDVLFFETGDDRVWAHTDRECFECPMTLSELLLKLPVSFEKASRSSIVNTSLIRSLVRSPTGVGTASFDRSSKRVFISRMYFKAVRGKIEETRLK
ncbi:MAG: LytTR family transcriptional regulator DNA-binding domain-containing protein [Clostridia bacterium]|nr:LytTR family transcriptional regulator DNA-binding domain-containing protein [Clostridia bacterium]